MKAVTKYFAKDVYLRGNDATFELDCPVNVATVAVAAFSGQPASVQCDRMITTVDPPTNIKGFLLVYDISMRLEQTNCVYPRCKCIVGTSTTSTEPTCPKGLPPL